VHGVLLDKRTRRAMSLVSKAGVGYEGKASAIPHAGDLLADDQHWQNTGNGACHDDGKS
jgi:hypothetical protein